VSSVRTILASLFTVLGGFCLLALTAGAGFAIYIWTIPDSISAPAEANAVARPPLVRAESASSVQTSVPRFAPVVLAATSSAPAPSAPSSKPPEVRRNAPEQDHQTQPAPSHIESVDNSSAMLTRAWAPAAMLTAPKEAAETPARIVSDASAAGFNRPNSVLAINDQTVTEPQSQMAPVAPASPAFFEGGTPLPATQAQTTQTASVADPDKPSLDEPSAQPSKAKKAKTARRRPAKDESVETTISKGFDSLQRSISSMF
jgi:hypothetical protein